VFLLVTTLQESFFRLVKIDFVVCGKSEGELLFLALLQRGANLLLINTVC
jgi:hypothetical protein